MLEISEPVNVWVFFREHIISHSDTRSDAMKSRAIIQPYCFFWGERKIKIEKVNLVHSSKEGNSTFYYFSVSSGGNFYKLRFDQKSLKWHLLEVEEEL